MVWVFTADVWPVLGFELLGYVVAALLYELAR